MHIADYRLAAEKAIEVLEEYEISRAPVSLRKIIKALRREIKIVKYSRLMKEKGLTKQEVIDIGDSKLGFSVWRKRTNQFVIFYNDIDFSEETCRFTIAHELGHIFLGHHEKAGVNILKESELNQWEYAEYEKEANNFARNLLSPAPLAAKLMKETGSLEHDLSIAFGISPSAAEIRRRYIRRDLKDYTMRMRMYVQKIRLMFGRHCEDCGTEVPAGASYCPMCGSNNIQRGKMTRLLPDGAPSMANDHFLVCPVCGNTEISAGSNFCRACGTILNNFCSGSADPETGIRRSHRNPSYARYCTVCGQITRYSSLHMKEDFSMVKKIKYREGVPFDENTKKIKICPKCGNTEFSSNALFCRICGTDLFNHCEGAGPFGNSHANPSNARYCEICGAPTYFFINNILPDFTDYTDPEEDGEQDEEIIQDLPFRRPEEEIPDFMSIPEDNANYQATGTDGPFDDDIDEELPFS